MAPERLNRCRPFRATALSPYRFAGLALVFFACFAAVTSAEERLARTTQGESIQAVLTKISEEAATFETVSGQRKIPLAELIDWGQLSDASDGTQVLLADGSLLVAGGVRLHEEKLIVQADLFGEPEGFEIAGTSSLPVSAVRAIVFRVPLDALARDKLMKHLAAAIGNDDQLLLANGDAVRGTFTALGRDKNDDKIGPLAVTIKTEAGDIRIASDKPEGRLLEKVTAMIFNPLLARRPRAEGTHTVVGLGDGSRLLVKGVEPKQDGQAVFELVCGAKIASHADVNIWEEIDFVQPQGGGIRYVTDLDAVPNSYKQAPLLDLSWPLGMDENVLGGRLRSGGHLYLRGLGMHAGAVSRVAYALDQPYRRLEADLAIDESAGERGSVTFVVLVSSDGRNFKMAGESAVVRGGEKPISFSVDITGARVIVLAVKSADRGTEMDRANWLNLRLVE